MRKFKIYRRRPKATATTNVPHVHRKLKWQYKVIFILVIIMAFSAFLEVQFRPVAMRYLKNETNLETTRMIQESVFTALEQQNLNYKSFVETKQAAENGVATLQTDVVALNRFTSAATLAITERLKQMSIQETKIPFGVFSGVSLFSGLGPKVSFKIAPTGNISTQIENIFEGVGINQTRHQIMLKVTVKVDIVLVGYTESIEVETSFCIAETIIVGEVPQIYPQLAAPYGGGVAAQNITG